MEAQHSRTILIAAAASVCAVGAVACAAFYYWRSSEQASLSIHFHVRQDDSAAIPTKPSVAQEACTHAVSSNSAAAAVNAVTHAQQAALASSQQPDQQAAQPKQPGAPCPPVPANRSAAEPTAAANGAVSSCHAADGLPSSNRATTEQPAASGSAAASSSAPSSRAPTPPPAANGASVSGRAPFVRATTDGRPPPIDISTAPRAVPPNRSGAAGGGGGGGMPLDPVSPVKRMISQFEAIKGPGGAFGSGAQGRGSDSSECSGERVVTTTSPVRRRNSTKLPGPLQTDDSTSALVTSLQLHYPLAAPDDHEEVLASSLTRQCALLCEQHCPSLTDINGEFGETYALDVACGPGGTTFELAQSFQFVLGIELDPELCLAAKEMKSHGSLQYWISINGGTAKVQCTAHVADDIDRDRVRFWRYTLPDLPPKMQPADAILLADVLQRTPDLADVLPNLPHVLKRHGCIVVVLPAAGVGGQPVAPVPGALSHELVSKAFTKAGLHIAAERRIQYTTGVPGAGLATAHGTVWRRSSVESY